MTLTKLIPPGFDRPPPKPVLHLGYDRPSPKPVLHHDTYSPWDELDRKILLKTPPVLIPEWPKHDIVVQRLSRIERIRRALTRQDRS